MKSSLLIFVLQLLIAHTVLSKPVPDSDDVKTTIEDNTDEESADIQEEEGNIDLESGKFFQGDIKLLPEQLELLLKPRKEGEKLSSRTGWILESFRWPKNKKGHVVVSYTINEADYTANQKKMIESAFSDIEKNTCVRFVRRTKEEDYINIHSDDGCYSYLGKIGGEQTVSLMSNGCMTKGTIQHELIHALGYDHMHSNVDRDKFISIKWENIPNNVKDNFDKVDPYYFSNFGTTYDLDSVMHYHSTAFSKNGRVTIVPRNPLYNGKMGQREGMSPGDIERVNKMYECPA